MQIVKKQQRIVQKDRNKMQNFGYRHIYCLRTKAVLPFSNGLQIQQQAWNLLPLMVVYMWLSWQILSVNGWKLPQFPTNQQKKPPNYYINRLYVDTESRLLYALTKARNIRVCLLNIVIMWELDICASVPRTQEQMVRQKGWYVYIKKH